MQLLAKVQSRGERVPRFDPSFLRHRVVSVKRSTPATVPVDLFSCLG
jgi:hypothetical protein